MSAQARAGKTKDKFFSAPSAQPLLLAGKRAADNENVTIIIDEILIIFNYF